MSSLSTSITITNPTADTIQALTRLTKTLLPINYPDKFFTALLQPPSKENGFTLAKVAIWNNQPEDASTKAPDQTQSHAHSQVVGGICGRIMPLEPDLSGSNIGEYHLYIATLAVLAPWRGQGIAAGLLRELVRTATDFTTSGLFAVPLVGRGLDVLHEGQPRIPHGTTNKTASDAMASDQSLTDSKAPVQPPDRLTGVYAHVWETNDSGLEWYQAQGFEVGEVIKGYYRKLRPDGARVVKRGVVGLVVGKVGGFSSSIAG